MDLKIHKIENATSGINLKISGSKSETNRWLILKELYSNITLENRSDSADTEHLLTALNSKNTVIDIGHAGTSMRFCTALFASTASKKVTLTGSDRMRQRPIGVLVNALKDLGAHIEYLENQGYPPLLVKGRQLKGGTIEIDPSVSSQFITALLLIAPSLENGIELNFNAAPTSLPYLEMTIKILQSIGVKARFLKEETAYGKVIVAPQKTIANKNIIIESDWSSAGYWYSWVALQPVGYRIKLNYYQESSWQGDAALQDIFKDLGVKTLYTATGLELIKSNSSHPDSLSLEMQHIPDQAQTLFATCLGLGIDLEMKGLHTLKIKETDRIEAMKIVGLRFRESVIKTTNYSIKLVVNKQSAFKNDVIVDTYNDHRMALAFAPLCTKTSLIIKDAFVIEKSYGNYWKDLREVNAVMTQIK